MVVSGAEYEVEVTKLKKKLEEWSVRDTTTSTII